MAPDVAERAQDGRGGFGDLTSKKDWGDTNNQVWHQY